MVKTRRRSYGPPAAPAAKKKRKPSKALPSIDSLHSIVKIMTENDCIGAKELGVLEQTCKTARTTICSGEVWEALCLRRWPNTKHFNRNFLRRLGGYRRIYMRRTSEESLRGRSGPEEPLPPSKLDPEELYFLIDIRANGKPVFSTSISGAQAGIDREDSQIARLGGVILSNIETVENVEYVLGTMSDLESSDEFVSDEFTVEVQMITPSRTCKFVVPKGHFRFYRDSILKDYERKASFVSPEHNGNIDDTCPCQIRSTLLGSAIQQRLGGRFSSCLYPVAHFVDGHKKLVVDSFQFEFYVGYSGFDKKVQDETGVRLLHVLENLEGTPVAP